MVITKLQSALGVLYLAVVANATTTLDVASKRIRLVDSLAAANTTTDLGKRYADSAASAGKGVIETAFRVCRDSAAGRPATKKSNAQDTVDVYLMLNRRGGVKDVVLEPSHWASSCLTRKIAAEAALPSPPGGNYWVRMRVLP